MVEIDREPATDHDYARLFAEHGPVVWRVLYAYTGGRRDVADEALAEAFARALERRATIRRPLPWIYRTALRIAAEELRRERSRGRMADGPAAEPSDGLEDLIGALRRLSPSQRAAIVLHYHADLPVREVAKLTGSSVASVKVHLSRGRRSLRALLGSQEESDA
jgi:RNA polymerase sigma-70 factor, ECF subfamily